MRCSPAATLLLIALLTGSTVGCSQGGLGQVPIHQLNLNDRGPARRPGEANPARARYADEPRVKHARQWRYIVIHHSATVGGNAEMFDRLHRGPQFGFDELGYHFLITNGDGGPDGAVEAGSRWHKQKWGAHCGGTPGNEYNNYGIGICLVGDFSRRMPTGAQVASLRKLVLELMAAYNVPAENVIAHREAPTASTECPGDVFYTYVAGTFRTEIGRQLAAAGMGQTP